MAKKVLTPEQAEIKALKKAKKSENWTKFWAILLAAVLTFGVFSLGKSAGEDAAATAATTAGTTTGGTTTGTTTGGATTGTTTGGTTTGTTTGGTTTGGSTAGAQNAATSEAVSAADVAKAFNDATAKAAAGSYEFTRVCKFQDGKGIKVTMLGGDATETLNGVIKAVDENADLNSVVGGFLGEGTRKIRVTNGAGVRVKEVEGKETTVELSVDEQFYLLKAMSLQEGDLVNPAKNGNVYSFALANVADPQRDGKNAMHRATDDFITEDRVKEAISGLTSAITVESANVSYYDIYFEATIEDGTLKSLKMSYKGDAVMKLKVALTIDGSGSLEVETNYVF